MASNAHFSPARYYAADGNGDFTVVNGSEPMSTNLRRDIEPKFLQLDWISRRLYWVEESIDQVYCILVIIILLLVIIILLLVIFAHRVQYNNLILNIFSTINPLHFTLYRQPILYIVCLHST